MTHIHAELIKKWAEGAKIEYQDDGEWFPIDNPSWSTKILYRVAAPLQPIATKWVVSNLKRGIVKRVSNDKYRPNDPAMIPFIKYGWVFHGPVIE